MRKWQRGVLWTVVMLGIAVIAGVLALRVAVDDAKLKEIAQEKVAQTWGRQLEVKTLTWNLFPYPQLHATGVQVSNAEWAQDKHIIEIDDISARLALMPLLSGKTVLKRLDFTGLTAHLEVDAEGRRNWDLPTTGDDDTMASKLPETLKRIDLTALHVKGGSIIYREPKAAAIEWQVPALKADGDGGLRDITFSAHIEREGHPLQVSGKFADLSQLGTPDAQTDGALNVKSGEAALSVEGMLPLTLTPRRYNINASVDAASMKELYGFFDLRQGLPAPLKASATIQGADAGITIREAKLQLGKLHASGEGDWTRNGGKPVFNARVQMDQFDMIQTFLDAGRPPLPPKREGELFRDNPLPWPALRSLDGTQGKLDVKIGLLNLRNGIDINDATAKVVFDNDRMTVQSFAGKLLGGTTTGDAVLVGRDKSVRLNLQLHDTSLGKWFKSTGKSVDMSGGSMQVDARLNGVGDSLKDLAASVSGPMNIRIGEATVFSPKAGHAEFWLTGLFSAKDADKVNLSCVSMRLPFQNGVARGEGIAGARSDASQLLTSGLVDMRKQEVDLRGRIRARSGVSLGISTFAGDVKIVGKINKPQLNLDEAGIGGAIARVGAAILTSGISIIATSIWDGANPESDPCQMVFSDKAKAAKGTVRRHSSNE